VINNYAKFVYTDYFKNEHVIFWGLEVKLSHICYYHVPHIMYLYGGIPKATGIYHHHVHDTPAMANGRYRPTDRDGRMRNVEASVRWCTIAWYVNSLFPSSYNQSTTNIALIFVYESYISRSRASRFRSHAILCSFYVIYVSDR